MKKSFILVLISCFYIAGLSAALPRAYTQKVTALGSVLALGQFPDVTCTSTATAPGYIVSAYITSRPTEIISTTTYLPAQIRLYRFGNGTTTPYDTRVYLQLGSFTSNWAGGETLRCTIENNNVSPSKTDFWDFIIPDNLTSAMTVTTPQEMDLWPVSSYNINVTSIPTGQPIYLGGTTTGFNTPHTFVEDTGFTGLFSVANPAYSWAPDSYQVTDLAADTDINFVGTFIPIIVTPNPAVNPMPANAATIQRAWNAPAVEAVTLSWEPATTGAATVGYKLIWNGGAAIDLGLVTTYTTPAIGAGSYTWKVIPYATDITSPSKSVALKTTVKTVTNTIVNGAKGENNGGATWAFSIAYDVEPTVVVTPTSETNPVIVAVIGTLPVPIATNPIVAAYICSFVGNNNLLIPILVDQRAFAYNSGLWFEGNYVQNPGFATWMNLAFGAKGDVPVVVVEPILTVIVTPNPAVNPMPANAATIQRAWNAPATEAITLQWEPAASGPAPEGYKLLWNGGAAIDLGLVTTYATPDIGAGTYTWKIIPYAADIISLQNNLVNNGIITSSSKTSSVLSGSRGENTDGAEWTFTIVYDNEPIDLPAGVATTVGDVTVTPTSDLLLVNVPNDDPALSLLPNVENTSSSVIMGLSGVGIVDISLAMGTGTWYCLAYVGGTWQHGNPYPLLGPGVVTYSMLNFSEQSNVILYFGEGADPTINPMTIDFTAANQFNNNMVAGDVNTAITFTATSNMTINSWAWDFDNDGTIDSQSSTPTWIYNNPGLKSVSLQISDGVHSNNLTKIDYLLVRSGVVVPPAVINDNLVWTESGGPYNLIGELLLSPTASLIIQPNTQVNLLVDSLLVVHGNLNITDAVFTAYGANGWGGMVLNTGVNVCHISGVTIDGATTGITITECSPILNNLAIHTTTINRNPETAIKLEGSANPIINGLQIVNFASGIKGLNSSMTNVSLNFNNIQISRGQPNPAIEDIGIDLSGNYSAIIDSSSVSGFYTGIRINGSDVTRAQARLTNTRIRNTESSSRSFGTACKVSNLASFIASADSLIGFFKGFEITNNGSITSNLNITHSTITREFLQSPNSTAIMVNGLSTGVINSLDISNYDIGIALSGNNQLLIDYNHIKNCSNAYKGSQNTSLNRISYNLCTRDAQYNGNPTEPAFVLESCANPQISNNTVFGFTHYMSAYSIGNINFTQNIAWHQNPGLNPITITGTAALNATYNDIALVNGVLPGTGNINSDPMFEDASAEDFHLNVYSPCIDSGNPNSPPDPDNSIADMGAFVFDQNNMPLIADFYYDICSGAHPLNVHFTDHSTFNAISWSWDFNGDGIVDSSDENPTWTFSSPGIYSVRLTVFDGVRHENKFCPDLISVSNAGPGINTPLPDLTLSEDFDSIQIDLNSYFSDPNGDTLTYACSVDGDAANVSIDQNYLVIASIPNRFGSISINVYAEDNFNRGLRKFGNNNRSSSQNKTNRISINDSFEVTVNSVNDIPVIEVFVPADSIITIANVTTIDFSISAIDLDSNITYQWFVNNLDQSCELDSYSYQVSSSGLFTVRVIVSDDAGDFAEHSWMIQSSVSNGDVPSLPLKTALFQNQPNPFIQKTVIYFNLKDSGSTSLSVYNSRGQLVRNLSSCVKQAGYYSQVWDGYDDFGNDTASGIYILVLRTRSDLKTIKLLRIK